MQCMQIHLVLDTGDEIYCLYIRPNLPAHFFIIDMEESLVIIILCFSRIVIHWILR